MLAETRSADELIALEERWGAHNYEPLDIVVERAEGVWLYDVAGRRYLDCLAAYSSVNHGHRHPKLLAAFLDQVERVTLTSRACRNDQLPFLCEELAALCGMETVLPMNTGTDAAETAIKVARRWGYERKDIPQGEAQIIVCHNNFHGRTITILSFSSDAMYCEGFGPFTPGFISIPYGDARALEDAITPYTCAFLMEPIQGDAGIVIPPEGYLREVREICTRRNVLWLADEVLTGLGRTGRRFACDHEDVRPDVYILGKSLSGGFYPISAVVSSREILDVLTPGSHGSTYCGNPVGSAVARAALRVLEEERLAERAAELGEWFLTELKRLRHPHIQEVRGKGLLVGLALTVPARQYCEALKERGVLCRETHETVIRIYPPLVITREELSWALEQLRAVFAASSPPRANVIGDAGI
jgi:ornithine--oxo-acid transaminase